MSESPGDPATAAVNPANLRSSGLTTDDYVESAIRDTLALAAAAEGDLEARIGACPQWNVADLVWHLREVQFFWNAVVAGPLSAPPSDGSRVVRPPEAGELLSDLRAGIAVMAETFRAARPETPCWTWAAQKDVAFVVRHQAQEAAVHRWDAQQAVGIPDPIEARIAADAVTEFLQFGTADVMDGSERLLGPVLMVAVDTGSAWLVSEDDDRILAFTSTHSESGQGEHVLVEGTASDLLLTLYRRCHVMAGVTVTGEANSWLALVARSDLS